MCDGILIGSVCTFSISDGLCLFQGQEPGLVQRNEAFQPPLQGRGHDVFQPLDLPDGPFFSDGDDDGQAENRAASSVIRDPGAEAIPPAAAGIFLFSPKL